MDSRANQAAAFPRISRSSLSCLFSRRSSRSSRRSSVVSPSERSPSSRSSCSTHFRIVFAVGSNSVRPREQLLPDSVPVFAQIRLQLIDRHSVDARTTLVVPHALECLYGIPARDDLLHQQVVAFRALSTPRRPTPRRTFTSESQNMLGTPKTRGIPAGGNAPRGERLRATPVSRRSPPRCPPPPRDPASAHPAPPAEGSLRRSRPAPP